MPLVLNIRKHYRSQYACAARGGDQGRGKLCLGEVSDGEQCWRHRGLQWGAPGQLSHLREQNCCQPPLLECIECLNAFIIATKFTFSLFSCWGQSRFVTYSCSPSTKAFLWDWAAQGAWLTAGTNSGKWGRLKKRSRCAMQRGLIRAQAVRAAQEAVLASC